MKLMHLLLPVFLFLHSCAQTRQDAVSEELKDKDKDKGKRKSKIELGKYLDGNGVLYCETYLPEGIAIQAKLNIVGTKITKADIAATMVRNFKTDRTAENGWFLKTLNIQDSKVELQPDKNERKFLSVSELIDGESKETLILDWLEVDSKPEFIRANFSYWPGSKPITLNGGFMLRLHDVFCGSDMNKLKALRNVFVPGFKVQQQIPEE